MRTIPLPVRGTVKIKHGIIAPKGNPNDTVAYEITAL